MKILMVNKFLYAKGGAETYMLALAKQLRQQGHETEFFGMDSPERCVSNCAETYSSFMDFQQANLLQKMQYSLRTVYSAEARKKIRAVLNAFQPDIVHLHNINFQLTPSIIYEVKKHGIPLVQTLHDVQIVCPNHRFYIEASEQICTACTDGKFFHCIQNKCIHHSTLQSALAAIESYLYHFKNTYQLVDAYICPSRFLTETMVAGGIPENKLITLHNFSPFTQTALSEKQDYALYFGRISVEKGVKTLIKAFAALPHCRLLIAGTGPLEETLKAQATPNVEFLGFQSGDALKELIAGARFSLYPSEWYENCPMSILESLSLGTPVIVSDIGGSKELIDEGKTGLTFTAGDADALKKAAEHLWKNPADCKAMGAACLEESHAHTLTHYADTVTDIYHALTKAHA